MSGTVYITIACDTDPDRALFVPDLPTDRLSWRGMLEGIPRAKDRLAELTDDKQRAPRFTWCLRADEQIRMIYDDYAWVLREHRALLDNLIQSGDELGWHPHFWRFDEDRIKWYQEVADREFQVTMLKRAHAEFCEHIPEGPASMRTGWVYHSPESFAAINDLGIKVDMSAIPKQKLMPKNPKAREANFYDWYITPNEPFRPSKVDHRRPEKEGEQAFNTLEFPCFASQSRLWSLFGASVLMMKMRDIRRIFDGLAHPSYFVNITAKPVLFEPLIKQARKNIRRAERVFFTTYFHPDELLEHKNDIYKLEHMAENLEMLIDTLRAKDAEVIYTTGAELPGLLDGEL